MRIALLVVRAAIKIQVYKSRGKKSNDRRVSWLPPSRTWSCSVVSLCKIHTRTQKDFCLMKIAHLRPEIFSMAHRWHTRWARMMRGGRARAHKTPLFLSPQWVQILCDYFHQLQRRGFIFCVLERGVEWCENRIIKISSALKASKSADFAQSSQVEPFWLYFEKRRRVEWKPHLIKSFWSEFKVRCDLHQKILIMSLCNGFKYLDI